MAIRSRTRTTCARLDAEQIVEQRRNEMIAGAWDPFTSHEFVSNGTGLALEGLPIPDAGTVVKEAGVESTDEAHGCLRRARSEQDIRCTLRAERLINISGSNNHLSIMSNQDQFGSRNRVTLSLAYDGPSSYIDLAVSVSLDRMSDHPQMQSFENVLCCEKSDTAYTSIRLVVGGVASC